MQSSCYIFFTLMVLSFSAVNVEAAFDSSEELHKKMYEAGFHYIIEVPFSREMEVKVLKSDGGFERMSVARYEEDFDIEYLPELNYRLSPSKPLRYAYRVGDALVCYIDQYYSFLAGRYLEEMDFDICLVFPYKITDVLKEMFSN